MKGDDGDVMFIEIIKKNYDSRKEEPKSGSISTWEDLTTLFLTQFFPPGRTVKLHNDILMFQPHQGESLSEAWNRFKDLLYKVPHHGIDLWLQDQISYDHVNPATRRTFDQSVDGKLRDKNTKESLALLEDLAIYENKSWNDPRDFAKPVKAISLPQDVPITSDPDFKQQQSKMTNKINTDLKAIIDRITGALPNDTVKNLKLNVNSTSPVLCARSYPTDEPQCSTRIHSSINAIIKYPKRPGEFQNRSISTWEALTTLFLTQFFPPGRTIKLRNDILMFQPHQGESLSEAWNHFKDLLYKVPHHGIDLWLQDQISYDHVNPATRRTIDQSVDVDFKQQQSKMTNKINTDLKALIDRITGALPNDTVKNLKLNVNSTSPVLCARSYPTDEPQCSTRIHSLINAIIKYPKRPGEFQNSKLEEEDLVPQSSNIEFVCMKGDDGDVMFIEIIKKNYDSRKEEPKSGENAKTGELKVEYFDIFLTRSELAYHKYLMSGLIPLIFLRNPIFT
nr:zinc finger, CCHC-type [Tanacetum cinerariifolium]